MFARETILASKRIIPSFCHAQKLKIIQAVLGGCSLHFHNAEGIRLLVSQKGNSADAYAVQNILLLQETYKELDVWD